jgi:integrase
LTKNGERIGSRPIKSITPRGADKLYEILTKGKNGPRLRTAEKIVMLCRKAWKVVHRLYPHEFDTAVPNPWIGVTMKSRVKLVKPAVTRDQVYEFASGCVEHRQPECAAAAVICFEWLQRPENVIAGHIKWSGYRSGTKPTIQVFHHKTGEVVDHPLEEKLSDGSVTKFYNDAEVILSQLPRRGIPMILRDMGNGKSKPYSASGMEKIVQRMRKRLGMPELFTLDACRHGGITELDEAELTDGQGRALSSHRTQDTYARYAKRTAPRILSATRKRYAHRLANQSATSVQNEAPESVQNENPANSKSA